MPKGLRLRKETVKCRDCHFWIPYTRNERERGLGLENMRPCRFFLSPKWLMPTYGDDYCGYGERKQE